MTFSTLFMLVLILLLTVLFMYKQRIETFIPFKHLLEGDSLISHEGSYAESVHPHILEILSTSSSKPGKICIDNDTDRICLDKSAAVSAYTVTEYKDNVDATLNRLDNDLTKIALWNHGTGTDTERLITYLSKQYYPKHVTYTKSEMNDTFINNIPARDYLNFSTAALHFLPTDYDKDGYRYLLNIESANRYYPHPGLSNVYITYPIADEFLEPRAVPANVEDVRYSEDQFVTQKYLDAYSPFTLYKTDFNLKLSETLEEQKSRYDAELKLLETQRANAATLLRQTRESMLADIEQTKMNCDSTKAKGYLKDISDYETKANSLYSSMEHDIKYRIRDQPSIVVTDIESTMAQIKEQHGFAETALPFIQRYESSIPQYIRRIQAARTMEELTTIQREYVDMIKNCEQYINNMDTGSTLSRTAHGRLETSKTTLTSQLTEEEANARRVQELQEICTHISQINASCNVFNFDILIMNIESEINGMKQSLYQHGSTTAFMRGISESEGQNLLAMITEIQGILNTIKSKRNLAHTEKNKIITAQNSCNRSNTTLTSATSSKQAAETAKNEFNRLFNECNQIRLNQITPKIQAFYSKRGTDLSNTVF